MSLQKEHTVSRMDLLKEAFQYIAFVPLFVWAYALANDGRTPDLPIPGTDGVPMYEFPGLVPLAIALVLVGTSLVTGLMAMTLAGPRVARLHERIRWSPYGNLIVNLIVWASLGIGFMQAIGVLASMGSSLTLPAAVLGLFVVVVFAMYLFYRMWHVIHHCGED